MAIPADEIGERLARLAQRLSRSESKFLVLGGKRLEGLMKRRIFNAGKDTSDQKIGSYKSTYWEKKRKAKGRQTSKVDLQFTGSLLTSTKTVKDGKDVVIAIVNDLDYKKARGNEQRRKKDIFLPTKKEIRQTEDYMTDLIIEDVEKEILNL